MQSFFPRQLFNALCFTAFAFALSSEAMAQHVANRPSRNMIFRPSASLPRTRWQLSTPGISGVPKYGSKISKQIGIGPRQSCGREVPSSGGI